MANFTRDQELKMRWDMLIEFLSDRFSDGADVDVEGVLYLIGLQEYGKPHERFKKEDNVNLIHIGLCTILEPFGHYRLMRLLRSPDFTMRWINGGNSRSTGRS